jgi:hypothetical protein
MRGLDPRIHVFLSVFAKTWDGRVKPGHDALGCSPATRPIEIYSNPI